MIQRRQWYSFMAYFTEYTTLSQKEVLSRFSSSLERGLVTAERKKLLAAHGVNEVAGSAIGWFVILRRQFASSFIYLLIFAAVLAIVLREYIDGVMIVLFVLLNASIGFYQEYRSEQTMKLLQQFVVRRTRILRDGEEAIIASRELVPGDVVILEPGDICAADIRILNEANLTIDESTLTGESVPIKKTEKPLDEAAGEIFQATNIVFSGTTIVSGKGIGVVIATGKSSVMGDISHLATETPRVSAFAKGLNKFSSFILRLVVVTLVFIVLANLFIKGLTIDIPDLIIFAIALAVSVIPEALPIVTTFSLSRGALHLSKHHVVVRRLSAIEDLGSIEVLCTDKTGTLTENVLTVAGIFGSSGTDPIVYGSMAAPFLTEKKQEPNNAIDRALWTKLSAHEQKRVLATARLDEVPFDPDRRRNAVVVEHGGRHDLIVRGAPEEVMSLCPALGKDIRASAHSWIESSGKRGERIIAIAQRSLKHGPPYSAETEEHDLQFIGLVSFSDPLKKTTIGAVQMAKKLGVAVKILTGDSKEVAASVAMRVGLIDDASRVITGSDFDRLAPARPRTTVAEYAVFARVSPQQKYRIIQLLQETREVGFLGEGINDAPALKIANVAMVVDGAADIAREAADIVLMRKSLDVVIDGIQEGRAVFVNTVKYIKATLASNFGNFYAVAIASLLIPFLPMLPLQLLLLNLLSDFPMIAIAADRVDLQDLKKPQHYNVREIVLIATVLGIISSIFDFVTFSIFFRMDPAVLQTNWFIASVLTELVFLFSVRTRFSVFRAKPPAKILIVLSVLTFLLTITVPFTPIGQTFFHFIPPSPYHLAIIGSVVATYFVVTEGVKLMYYRMVDVS